MRSRHRSGFQDAEALAIRALTFIAADESRLARFLSLTGLDPGTIRDAAGSPGFLGAVLDFIADDEALLLDFASATEVRPETFAAARESLAPSHRGE